MFINVYWSTFMVMVYLHKYVYWFIHCVGLSENGGCPWNSHGETQGLSLKFATVPYLIDTTTPALLETWNFLLVGEVEAAFVKVDDLANSWRFEGWLILIHVNIQGEKSHVFARFIPMFTSYCYVYQTNCLFCTGIAWSTRIFWAFARLRTCIQGI